MKKAGAKKIAWKVVIIAAVVLPVCAYYLSSRLPLFPLACSRACDWWEEKTGTTTEELRAKQLEHVKSLERPKLTGKEVASILKREKGIRTQELYDMVDWYVYHGDRDVIRQVLANRQFEMKITLPRVSSSEGGVTTTDYTVYEGYQGPSWGTDIERLIHRQEIHKYAANKDTDPHFISYLLRIGVTFDTEEYRNRYAQQLFYDDILAYLRIYVNYKDWPTIRGDVEYEITHYPCGWRDWHTIKEVLKIAEEQGAEPAYELYMQRYRSNYQKFSSITRDLYEWKKKIYKSYECESVFQGWSSENLKAEMRVYNVDSDKAVIGIKHVEKIISILRDGEDITHLCHLTPENVMTIPLKAAEVIELKYKISVGPQWWDRYHAK